MNGSFWTVLVPVNLLALLVVVHKRIMRLVPRFRLRERSLMVALELVDLVELLQVLLAFLLEFNLGGQFQLNTIN